MESKKQISYKLNNEEQNDKLDALLHDEQAAGMSDVEPFVYASPPSNKNTTRNNIWIKFAITGLLAVVIGVGFGLTLLYIFAQGADQDHDQVNETSDQNAVSTTETGDKSNDYTLAPLSGYVIQVGVFQTSEQAEQYQSALSEEGFSSVLWDTEEGYRAFIGVYSTEEEAKANETGLNEAGFDSYVRQWHGDERSLDLSDQEHEWLSQFSKLWEQALVDFNDDQKQSWATWLEIDKNSFSQSMQAFYQQITQHFNEMEANNRPIRLLEMWQAYQNLNH